MEKQTKDINIKEEQRKIKDKIQKILDSKVFDKIHKSLSKINNDILEKTGMSSISLEGRVKKEDSASEKIERQGVSADRIYDLIGFMLVVELPEEYEKVSSLMKELMPEGSFIHNFDGKLPENNGYSSFHMGINVNQLLNQNGVENTYGDDDGLQTEVQLKSYGMYMAQEATHDSIYKNKSLSSEQKDRMQSVMFPLIEKITDIEKYQDRLEVCFDEEERARLQSRIETAKQEVLQHKTQNKQFIEENMTDVENVLKEYVVVKYVEKVRQDPVLNLTREKITEIAEQCNRAVTYLSNDFEQERMSNTEPTGFKNTDKLLEETQEKTIEEIQSLSAKSQEKATPNLLQGAIRASESEVTVADIKTMVGTVNEKARTPEKQVHISAQEQENEER